MRAPNTTSTDELPGTALGDATAAAANTSNWQPRPDGRAPPHCDWDGNAGDWRDRRTGELRVPPQRNRSRRTTNAARAANAQGAARRRGAAAAGSRQRRRQLNHKARCHAAMFQPGFSLTDLAADSVDALGDATCDYCNALLFPGEAKTVRGGKTRGRSCCSEGAVVLPAIKTHAQLDALWADQSDRSAKVLRENVRKFNNALALLPQTGQRRTRKRTRRRRAEEAMARASDSGPRAGGACV